MLVEKYALVDDDLKQSWYIPEMAVVPLTTIARDVVDVKIEFTIGTAVVGLEQEVDEITKAEESLETFTNPTPANDNCKTPLTGAMILGTTDVTDKMLMARALV